MTVNIERWTAKRKNLDSKPDLPQEQGDQGAKNQRKIALNMSPLKRSQCREEIGDSLKQRTEEPSLRDILDMLLEMNFFREKTPRRPPRRPGPQHRLEEIHQGFD